MVSETTQHFTGSASVAKPVGARSAIELLSQYDFPALPAEFELVEERTPQILDDLVNILSELQLKSTSVPNASASSISLISRYLVAQQRKLNISRVEAGAIYFIDRMFDTLLRSNRYDSRSWHQLIQMRFPITKYALQDFSFFFAPQNNGRRLLNLLALHLQNSTALADKDTLLKIQEFINTINRDYTHKIADFNQICIRAFAFFNAQQKLVKDIEQRISIIQQPGSLHEISDTLVIDTINQSFANREFPCPLIRFINTEWRVGMAFILDKYGPSSTQWKRVISLTGSMSEMATVCKSTDGQESYKRFLEPLLKGIEASLQHLHENPEQLKELLHSIRSLFTDIVNGHYPSIKVMVPLQAGVTERLSYQGKPIDEQITHQIDALSVGDWLRFKIGDNQYETCKVAVKGLSSKPWYLVNNVGSKLTKTSRVKLAHSILKGEMDVLGNGRWIESLIEQNLDHLATKVEESTAPSTASHFLSLEAESLTLPSNDTCDNGVLDKNTHENTINNAQADLEEPSSEADDNAIETSANNAAFNHDAWNKLKSETATVTPQELTAADEITSTLEVGATVSLCVEDNITEASLAVKMSKIDKYVFVNKLGIKIVTAKHDEISQLIATGNMIVHDSGKKFDRTLEAVVKNIQADKHRGF